MDVLPPLAVTMGEPAGIGGELSLMTWCRKRDDAVPTYFVRDDANRLERLARRLRLTVPIARIRQPEDAVPIFNEALPVLHTPIRADVEPGQPNAENAEAVTASIERAVRDVMDGRAGGVVTQPIHKAVLMRAGFPHPGHTEFLGALAGVERSVMMLSCDGLRVVPVTVHIPLSEVPVRLTSELIEQTARVVAADLRRYFGIASPRLAMAGLNPHAGEDGALGQEEIAVIGPALDRLREQGLDIEGPLPGDTMFHPEARAKYDAALCAYHDQALIPLKTLDFHGGVNVTLGLGFVRTSPDHGTAFALAGTGRANPASFLAALRLAAAMTRSAGPAHG